MPVTTKTIDEVLEFFLNNLTTPKWDALMDLLADDAVMEFPYAPPDRPQKLTGRQEIVPYFGALKNLIRLDEVRLVVTHKTMNPNVVILESEGKGQAVQTGRPYEPKYITVLTFRDGRIARWRDYWNPFTVLVALGGTISFPKSEE